MNYIRYLKYAKWGLEKEITSIKNNIENNKEYTENSYVVYHLNRLLKEYERDLNFLNKKLDNEHTFVDIL
jgi:hypothetical protein|uniref:Uncharacterized protein n=1 Tax=Myoviridae sp. ctfyA6 TaxID=2827698 RepID=A0A8S5SSY4_9CAUD|nr:MAG TPA: hypothetical protein [Myoviridae sp. ctfyA6]